MLFCLAGVELPEGSENRPHAALPDSRQESGAGGGPAQIHPQDQPAGRDRLVAQLPGEAVRQGLCPVRPHLL